MTLLSERVHQWVHDWNHCTRCTLHKYRTRVVHWRGRLPASILYLGEAPGGSEDVVGSPFCGPSGDILDQILDHLYSFCEIYSYGYPTHCIGNVIGCQPPQNRDPKPKELKACAPRVERMIDLCRPKRIIFLGKVPNSLKLIAKENSLIRLLSDIPAIKVMHPAAIAREDASQHVRLTRLEASKIFNHVRPILKAE